MFIKSEMSSFCRHFSKSFQRNGSRDFGHVDVVHVRKRTALLAVQVEELSLKNFTYDDDDSGKEEDGTCHRPFIDLNIITPKPAI